MARVSNRSSVPVATSRRAAPSGRALPAIRSERHRDGFEPAIVDPVVVGDQSLRRDVVLVEAQPRGAHREGSDGFTGWQPLEIGNRYLDDETPTGLQVRGDVLETGDLLVLRREVHDRVEDQIGNRKTTLNGCRGEVADRYTDLFCAWLRLQPRHHRLGQINAMYADAASRQ